MVKEKIRYGLGPTPEEIEIIRLKWENDSLKRKIKESEEKEEEPKQDYGYCGTCPREKHQRCNCKRGK